MNKINYGSEKLKEALPMDDITIVSYEEGNKWNDKWREDNISNQSPEKKENCKTI